MAHESSTPRPLWEMPYACWEAWQQQRPDAWDLFLTSGSSVNAVADDGWTPIRWALHSGNLDVLNRLIENGADLSVTTRENGTLVEQAFTEHRSAIALRLLQAGSPLAVTDRSPLGELWVHEATTWGSAALLDAVLDHPQVPPVRLDPQQRTELLNLIGNASLLPTEQAARIPRLVARGSDVNATGPDGHTALMLAVLGTPKAHFWIEPLLQAGADPTAPTPATSTMPSHANIIAFAQAQNRSTAAQIVENWILRQALRQDLSLTPNVATPPPGRARL